MEYSISSRNSFVWKSSRIGGGGYITGIVQHPLQPHIWYARCDVAGMFKSEDGGRSWKPINRNMTACHHHSVQSFCISPHDPKILFRCSGEARGGRIFGSIHRSRDGGESWEEVCNQVDYFGNGPTRMHGEVIGIHPVRPDFVLTGGYSKGIFISHDLGESWSYSGLEGERISCCTFHPVNPDIIYVGTLSDRKIKAPLHHLHDFPRGDEGKLFISKDRGRTWDEICRGPDFSELLIDPDQPERMLAACRDQGILKSGDSGHSWSSAMSGLPDNISYNTLASAPDNPSVLYTMPQLFGRHLHLDPIAVYRSEDSGESWSLVHHHEPSDLHRYPSYMTIRHAGWSVSKLRVDWHDPERLLLANWYGVAVSNDGGKTWDANHYEGLETTCGESIIVDRRRKRIYCIAADHAPGISTDSGNMYTSFKRVPEYTDSTALAVSSSKENFVLFGTRNRSGHDRCVIVKSEDHGQTATVMKEFNSGFIQALAEDRFHPGGFYAYIDGELDDSAGVYYSKDWGETWVRLNHPFPDEVKTLPVEKHWIEAELLSVVVNQLKNVCGTNQLLLTDPHSPGYLYVGERSTGIYMSRDQGSSWERISDGLPLKRDQASVLNVLKADEKRPGVIYAGMIREGLWMTENYGKHWTKLFPRTYRIYNASSVAVGGGSPDDLFVASEPLYWSLCESAVYYSPDRGQTWHNIQDDRLGAIRWKSIEVDANGRLYGVSCGNGCFVGTPSNDFLA